MTEITILKPQTFEVKYLQVEAGVRYFEDATVNDKEDEDGLLMPFRSGDCWCPVINLETGIIEGWPGGTTARVHYKVCDAGIYTLLDAGRSQVSVIEGYVPKIMCPGGSGHGDYIIMNIGSDGQIENWRVDLTPFAEAGND